MSKQRNSISDSPLVKNSMVSEKVTDLTASETATILLVSRNSSIWPLAISRTAAKSDNMLQAALASRSTIDDIPSMSKCATNLEPRTAEIGNLATFHYSFVTGLALIFPPAIKAARVTLYRVLGAGHHG